MFELTAPPNRTGLKIWLILSQLLAAGSLLIWVAIAGLSVMAFDSGESPEAWAFVITVWSYPLLPLGLAIGAWIAYRKRKDKLAAILSGLTFAPAILVYVLLSIASLLSLP